MCQGVKNIFAKCFKKFDIYIYIRKNIEFFRSIFELRHYTLRIF
jgi:hypothetical protein